MTWQGRTDGLVEDADTGETETPLYIYLPMTQTAALRCMER